MTSGGPLRQPTLCPWLSVLVALWEVLLLCPISSHSPAWLGPRHTMPLSLAQRRLRAFHWSLCGGKSRPHTVRLCLVYQQSSLIERTLSKMCIQRCVHTSLGEPNPNSGWHEGSSTLGQLSGVGYIKATNGSFNIMTEKGI